MINTSDPIFIIIFLSLSGIILRTTLVLAGQNWSKTFHYHFLLQDKFHLSSWLINFLDTEKI